MEKKILIVDDDIQIGALTTYALGNAGYKTHFQTSLISITDIIRRYRPDVIILDVEIGSDNGIDEIPRIKLIDPSIPILFITSHDEDALYSIRAIKEGADNLIRKPFSGDELVAHVERYISNHKSGFVEFGSMFLDVTTKDLYHNDDLISRLTDREFAILKLLLININDTTTRTEIEEYIEDSGFVSDYSINNTITKLRKYIKADTTLEIKTLHKVGYLLSDKVE